MNRNESKLKKAKLKHWDKASVLSYVKDFSCIIETCERELLDHCTICSSYIKISHKD